MAEKVIKKLNEQLNCIICLDTYTDPRLLQCTHAYCTECLIDLVVRDWQGQLVLNCPICRQVTPVPSNGVTGLQSAFRINDLLEIRDDFKDSVPSLKGDSHYCSEHAGKELELFCETCNKLICYICVARGGKHHDHEYTPLDKYIMSLLEPMVKQQKTIHTALAQLNTSSREISDQRVTIEANIHDNIRRLHEILDVRQTELIIRLNQMAQRKLKTVTTQRDQIETIQTELSSCVHSVNENLKTSSQGEVMIMKTTIAKRVEELTISFQQDLLKPNAEADLSLSTSGDITAACTEYGEVLSPTLIDPLRCQVTGNIPDMAIVGEKLSVLLRAINYNDEPRDVPIQSVNCVLVSEITHATVNGSVERRGQSQYEISYQPTIKGRHQLHIKIQDQHIRGSPFTLAVTLPVEKLGGTPILTIDEVKEPCGITCNQKGEMVVGEWGGYFTFISIFGPSGEKIRSFGIHGSGGQSCGVAVDDEGNILVADSGNHRIQKLTTEGEFITSVGTKGKGPLQFKYPCGITYNRSNSKVYVVDNNHRVKVLNSDLTFSSSFGKKGSANGRFKQPRDISCDSTGNVYVADYENHRIQVFTAEGTFLRMFGRRGHGRGELDYPISITIDTSDRVYVGDKNHGVSVFSSGGQFITSFGLIGMPLGLAVDASGVVYVCGNNNLIHVF